MNADEFLNAAKKFASTVGTNMGTFAHLEEIPHMSSINREEINARIEAVEARMDSRVASISLIVETALAEMRADRETNKLRFSAVSEAIQDIKDQGKTLKSNIWFAAATTIASVLAAWALAFSAFDSGRETSKNIAEATAQMKQLQAQLEAQAKATIQPPPAITQSPPASNQPSPAAIQAPAPSQQ